VEAGGADNITAVLIPYHAPETPAEDAGETL